MKKTLPLKNGVPASSIWAPKGQWEYLLDFLCQQFNEVAREDWLSRLNREMVLNENGSAFRPNARYPANSRIYYYREVLNEVPLPFSEKILYQDEHLLVADKPHFMQIIPRGRYLHHTLQVRLQNQLNLPELSPLHRLDRETAGIVLFSKNPQTRGLYQSLFAQRKMHKTYYAIAPSTTAVKFPITICSRIERGQPFIKMTEVEGESNAETQIDVAKKIGPKCLYKLKPITGKTHQLRVHMASLGVAIENDPIYPKLIPKHKEDYSEPLKLLAKSISFQCPITDIKKEFVSGRMLE